MKPLSAVATTMMGLFLMSAVAMGQDAESCGVCHRSVHHDWLQSRHSLSWKSESFQAQMKAFGNPEFCGRCHAAETIWKTVNLRSKEQGLEAAKPVPSDYTPQLRDIAEFREETADDGVTCGTCHFIEVLWPTGKSGEFLGPYHSEAGHAGKPAPEFESFALCSTCHGRQRADYLPKDAAELSGFHHLKTQPIGFSANSGVPCGQCHMPRREERLVQLRVFKTLPTRMVGEHTFSGVRYQELANAMDFSLEKGAAGAVLVISNKTVGHAPQTSADTQYLLVLSEKGDISQTVELSGAATLEPGQSLRIPLEFAPKGSLQVDLVKRDDTGFEEKLFSKTL